MTELQRRYRGRYVYSENPWPRHSFEVIGSKGGMHFHATNYARKGEPDKWSAGLEIHSRTPLYDDVPPQHDHCWLLKCPCWHDGTTLYAEETLLPMFHAMDVPAFLDVIRGEADERFRTNPDD